jgi:hypothetical protein
MTEDDEPEDPSWLKDRDWVEVNKLRHAFKDGGGKALVKAWRDLLDKDALQFSRVMCAYFPDRARHIEDAIEERGYTLELIELAKKRRH